MVGRDGERSNLLLITIVCAHSVYAERIRQLGEPLSDEGACRRNDARARAQSVDGEQRDECLASPGRKHDRSPRARSTPAIHGLALVGTWIARIEERRVEIAGDASFVNDAVVSGPRSQFAESMARRDQRVEARIIDQPRRRRVRGNAAEDGEPEPVREGTRDRCQTTAPETIVVRRKIDV